MKQWPHAPIHLIEDAGAFMVTAGTYKKQPFFHSEERLQLLHDTLLEKAAGMGWQLQAWAVFSNHYHFVAISPDGADSLPLLIKRIHGSTSKHINMEDNAAGRKVWFQYWDSQITFQRSYLARLNYVHSNAVHHKIVAVAEDYPWCSARWFRSQASPSFCKVVHGMPVDKVNIQDDF